MNFLIISLGRSGSKFLAHQMNLSNKFKVLHDVRHINRLNGNVGEVNGISLDSGYSKMLNFKGERGVILRNTLEICLSKYNRCVQSNKVSKFESYLYNDIAFEDYIPRLGKTVFRHDLRIIDKFIQDGALAIYFDKMTSNKSYLLNIFEKFGINDVPLERISLESRNVWNKTKDDLGQFYDDVYKQSKWFIDKYGL